MNHKQIDLPVWIPKIEDESSDKGDTDKLVASQDNLTSAMGNNPSSYEHGSFLAAIERVSEVADAHTASTTTPLTSPKDMNANTGENGICRLQKTLTSPKASSTGSSTLRGSSVSNPLEDTENQVLVNTMTGTAPTGPSDSSSSNICNPSISGPQEEDSRYEISQQPTSQTTKAASPKTPQPFPLPPPPSRSVDSETLSLASPEPLGDLSDIEDSFPTLDKLLSGTQPKYSLSTSIQNRKTPITPSDDDQMQVDATVVSPTIKRRSSDSPCILMYPSPRKKKKKKINKATDPEYIVLSSDSDSEDTTQFKEAQPRPSEPSSSQMPKRKRTLSTAPIPPFSQAHRQKIHSGSQCRPPEKRAKGLVYTKHPMHWHLDGNFIIQLDGFRFKLHRSILARKSKWFNETFERGEAAPELLPRVGDELPVYSLDNKGVTARDFVVLLDALDDPFQYFDLEKKPTFDGIASILRAATAFMFDKFEAHATKQLTSMWSADLADLTTDTIPLAIQSIILANDVALFPVLKRALYELVRVQCFDQPHLVPGDPMSEFVYPSLELRELRMLIHARGKLTEAWEAALNVDLFYPCTGRPAGADAPSGTADNLDDVCTGESHAETLEAHDKLLKANKIAKFKYDPICGLEALVNSSWESEGFCQACVQRRREHWTQERERLWEKLDDWFGI